MCEQNLLLNLFQVSFTFGADVVSKFLNRHDLDLICRAHQVRSGFLILLCHYQQFNDVQNLFLNLLSSWLQTEQNLLFHSYKRILECRNPIGNCFLLFLAHFDIQYRVCGLCLVSIMHLAFWRCAEKAYWLNFPHSNSFGSYWEFVHYPLLLHVVTAIQEFYF